jgi:hypothetical protein
MTELSDMPLQALGLSVTELSQAGGGTLYSVRGETHPHRHLLRVSGDTTN